MRLSKDAASSLVLPSWFAKRLSVVTVHELGHQSIWDWAETPIKMFMQIIGQQSGDGNF